MYVCVCVCVCVWQLFRQVAAALPGMTQSDEMQKDGILFASCLFPWFCYSWWKWVSLTYCSQMLHKNDLCTFSRNRILTEFLWLFMRLLAILYRVTFQKLTAVRPFKFYNLLRETCVLDVCMNSLEFPEFNRNNNTLETRYNALHYNMNSII